MKLALACIVLAACVDVAPSFQCHPGDDSACINANGAHGHCEASGNCSFPDPSCGDQSFRYDASADPARAGVCVLSANAPSITQPQVIGATHTLAFEITTGPQMIVFDTGGQGTDTSVAMSLHWFAGSCPSPNAQGEMPQSCSGPVARILVGVGAPGPYCLFVADDPSVPQASVGLRAFPLSVVSPPTCLQ